MKQVFLAEDNSDDIFFMQRVCGKAGIAHELQVAEDGDLAVRQLSAAAEETSPNRRKVPDLVILDVKMPRRNGLEVLNWIRAHPAYNLVPVVMLTSSSQHTDIERAYRLGANSYLIKPARLQDLEQAIPLILKYWLELNSTM